MAKTKVIWTLIFLALLAGNAALGFFWYNASEKLQSANSRLEAAKTNEKTIAFAKLFVAKVLKSEGEVSFENRLKLENAVRELDNEAIFAQWKKFTDSATPADAQANVKDLLEILVNSVN